MPNKGKHSSPQTEFKKGHTLSEETKKKIGEASKGNKYRLGKKLSREHKRKISLKMKGRIFSKESREKMSEARRGRRLSEEQIKNMHKFPKGQTPWNKGLTAEIDERLKKISEERKGEKNPMFGNKYTEEERKKRSETQKGENHYNWKGGISPINHRIRNSMQYKDWRTVVFERDNYTCQKCGSKNGNGKAIYLNAHHILSFAGCPEKRFDIENGITLCSDCHKEF